MLKQISNNCQKSKKQLDIGYSHVKHEEGFTIVELLAVVFVFVIIGSLIVAILGATLRGNNKTNALNLVQSNGDYAITEIAKSVRNATTLLSPFPCGPVDIPTATSAVQLAFPDGTITTYSCMDTNGNPSITSNSAALIDTTSVSVAQCSFTCGQDTQSSYPIIGIDFFLQAKNANTFVETKASASAIEFQTSVVIRNLIR